MRPYFIKALSVLTAAEMVITGSVGRSISTALAQGTPSDAQHGPTSEQLAAFEQEQGASIDAFNQGAVEPPAIPEPEKIPDDIKKLVPEKDLLAIYCATVKWKSGDFYLAMAALKKYLIPAIEQARGQGVDLSAPDVSGMTAEGTRRVNAICNARTLAEAEQLTADFAQWGRDASLASITNIRTDMESKMKGAGDSIRQKVLDALKPAIAEETIKIEPEITAQAQGIVSSLMVSVDPKSPPTQESVQAQVNSQLQPIIQQKTAAIEARIRAKADQIVAPEKKRFESIGALFQGLDKKINDAIASGAGQYTAQKKIALALRRDLILKIFDANIIEATKQLDANAAQIEQARAADPSVMSAAAMKAELAKDRADLAVKIDAALANDDEAGVAQSMADIKTKWETVQQQAQKAAAESVPKMCEMATKQFASAKAQLQPAVTQMNALQTQCAQSTDVQCTKVNALADRIQNLSGKMTDLMNEMDLAKGLCQSSSPDAVTLMKVFTKIQNDGADAKTFGDALNAERVSTLANSVKAACDEALPQLESARVQLQNEDLIVLQNKLSACAGKTTPECTVVNGTQGKIAAFKTDTAAFLANVDRANALCKSSVKDDSNFEKVFSTLSALGDQADGLQAQGDDLKAEQAKNSSSAAYCNAAKQSMGNARGQIAEGLKQMEGLFSYCSVGKSATCDKMNTLIPDKNDVSAEAKSLLSRITATESACASASSAPASADLVQGLEGIQSDAVKLQQSIDALKAKADQFRKGNGVWIEAENETASYILPASQRPAVNMKETNPPWRPPFFGTGDWYLAAGGEWLSYVFNAPTAGIHTIWVRDYVDKFQARGIRRIVVDVNGKNVGTFAETTISAPGDRGAFGWHSIGTVTLTAGQNTLKVTKESTTRGAAILDVFYLTPGTDVPMEK